MKACKEFEARISALIDDELSPEERAAVLEHIADCPACKAYWEDLLTIGDILRVEIFKGIPSRVADGENELGAAENAAIRKLCAAYSAIIYNEPF